MKSDEVDVLGILMKDRNILEKLLDSELTRLE